MIDSWRQRMLIVFAIARTQRWITTSAQLAACGLGRSAVRRLVAAEWLRPVRNGAYAVGGPPPSAWDDVVAAGLLGGPGTAISHATAARIHDFPQLVKTATIELSAVPPRRPLLSGVVVHRVRHLDACDVVHVHGIPVTSPARTIVDLAPRLERPLLERVVDEGCFQGLWLPGDIDASERRAGDERRPGSRLIRSVIAPRLDEPRGQSLLEQRVLRLMAPFQPFVTQHSILLEGRVVVLDIAWPEWFFGIEVDGRRSRATSYTKFHEGKLRDNLLLAAGWKVIHVTAAMSDDTIVREVLRVMPEALQRLRVQQA